MADSSVYEGLPLSPYSTDELQEFRSLLLRKKAELLGSYQQISESSLQAAGESSGGLSDVLNHPGEHAAEMAEQELAIDILARLQRDLKALEEAIALIDRRRYGTCDNCRKAIPAVRLQAVPTARLCLGCQIQAEAA